MLVKMADRGGGVTDMACGLLIRISSCCHCSKKNKCNKTRRKKPLDKQVRGAVSWDEGEDKETQLQPSGVGRKNNSRTITKESQPGENSEVDNG